MRGDFLKYILHCYVSTVHFLFRRKICIISYDSISLRYYKPIIHASLSLAVKIW